MQAHIERELARLTRIARENENEGAYRADEAERESRIRDTEHCVRAAAACRAGEPEETFELREAAIDAERFRLIDEANGDVSRAIAYQKRATEQLLGAIGVRLTNWEDNRRAA